MKSIITLSLLFVSQFIYAQKEESQSLPTVLFKVSPQQFSINTIKVGAELFTKDKVRSVGLFLYGKIDQQKEITYYYDDDTYQGIGGEIQYRKYISPFKVYTTRRDKTYQRGIYYSLYLQAARYTNNGDFNYNRYDPNTQQSTITKITVNESISNWGTGFAIGYHQTLWSVLYLDVYLGGGVQFSNTSRTITPANIIDNWYYYSSITTPDYQGIMPKFGLLLGVNL